MNIFIHKILEYIIIFNNKIYLLGKIKKCFKNTSVPGTRYIPVHPIHVVTNVQKKLKRDPLYFFYFKILELTLNG